MRAEQAKQILDSINVGLANSINAGYKRFTTLRHTDKQLTAFKLDMVDLLLGHIDAIHQGTDIKDMHD